MDRNWNSLVAQTDSSVTLDLEKMEQGELCSLSTYYMPVDMAHCFASKILL